MLWLMNGVKFANRVCIKVLVRKNVRFAISELCGC